jgi:6,7-dimethyl-8-ribityllumazine synthase
VLPASKGGKRVPGKRPAGLPKGLSSRGCSIAVAAASFNGPIVARLIEGALEALDRTGSPRDEIRIVRVPGAFELPLAARGLAETRRYDAIVALGAVIRGETSHFEHVSRAAAEGLGRVSLDYGIPIGFGVLTTETPEQAASRAGGARGNLGFDAAMAAVEMIAVLRGLD